MQLIFLNDIWARFDLIQYFPGTLLFTGTPEGCGFARIPPVWLKAGDVYEVEIEGIGVLRNPVVGAAGH